MPFISDINETLPDGESQAGSVLDNHLRDLKEKILSSFPNLTGPVTATHTALNYLTGSSDVNNKINTLKTHADSQEQRDWLISGLIAAQGYPFNIPPTWLSEYVNTGWYRIHHDLGAGATYSVHVNAALPVNPTNPAKVTIAARGIGTYFEVNTYDFKNAKAVDSGFTFIVAVKN